MNPLYSLKNISLKYKKAFLTHNDISEIYDELSKTHSSILSSGFLENLRKFSNFLQIKSNMRILDIGCGDGSFTYLMPEDSQYLGIDISQKMIDKALKEKEYKTNKNNIFFEKINAEDFLKFSSPESYDLIVLSFSWKYFDRDFFKKLFVLLKNNGQLLIINGIKENEQELLDLYNSFKKENSKDLLYINPFTYSPTSVDELHNKLADLGFSQTVFGNF